MSDSAQDVQVVAEKSYAETAQRRMVVTFRSTNRAALETTHVRNEALRIAAANGVPGGGITNTSAISPVTDTGEAITQPKPVAGPIAFEVTLTVQGTA